MQPGKSPVYRSYRMVEKGLKKGRKKQVKSMARKLDKLVCFACL